MAHPTRAWTHLRVELIIFAAALLVRIVFLIDLADSPTFTQPIVDSKIYDSVARALVAGEAMDYRLLWQPFFYPVFLSIVYALSGSSIIVAKVVQIVLGSITCVLVYRLGSRLLGGRIGVVAAVVTMLYGPLLFFETELVAAGWASFWSVALLLLFLNAEEKNDARWSIALGLVGGLAVLTRPTFLPFFGVSIVVWGWRLLRHSPAPVPWRRLLQVAVGFAVVTTPVALLNQRVTGELSFLPASGGINFFIGNYPEPCETITIRPGSEWTELNRLADPTGSRDVARNQAYFYARAADLAKSHPLGVLRGLGRKVVQFISSREIPRNVDLYVFRQWSTLHAALTWKIGGFGFPYGLLLPLAVLGLWWHRRSLPVPMILFLVLTPLAVVMVFVSARYRVPVIPALSVFAAAGLVGLIDCLRRRRTARAVLAVGVAAVLVALASLPGPFCEEEENYEAELLYAVGYRWHRDGQLNQAISYYSEAVRLRPDYAEVYNQLAVAQRQKGNSAAALQSWRKAIEHDPDFVEARINLGAALAREGDFEAAIESYNRAIELRPESADAHHNLAVTLAQLERFPEAMPHFGLAVRYGPKYADLYARLAVQYETEGQPEVARAIRAEIQRAQSQRR